MANRIDSINLTVAQITDLTQPLSLAQGGVGATTPEGGRKTLGFDTMGIGVSTNALSGLDWQNFDFVPGANYSVLSGNMTNVPTGLDVPGPTYNVSIRAYGPEGGTRHVDVCFSTTTASNYRYYQVRLAGALGSRTFTVRQIWTGADTIPVANGGTGATTAATALTNLGAVPTTRTVNGKTLSSNVVLANADISGSAASGNNSDITTLNALTNIKATKAVFELSPTIPDGAQPYDAVNLRQLQAAGSGGGANMNGVMNNYIGAVEWFNGSRAKLPAGYIAADGQVVSRTDAATADLWAAVDAQILSRVTDTDWLNGPGGGINAGQYRGKYSLGGTSNPPSGSGVTGAWFRVPDLNGATASSIPALFLRGDAGGRISTEIGSVGEVLPAAAPNIEGSVGSAGTGIFQPNTNSKALSTGAGSFTDAAAGGAANSASNILNLNAKNSSQVYGRVNANGTTPATEIRPNSVAGIWIIRASGAFTAANTAFSVIAGDATKPSNGTTVKGGNFVSSYQIAGVEVAAAGLQVQKVVNSEHSVGVISVFNKGTGGAGGSEVLRTFSFQSDGTAYAPTHYAVSTIPQISYDQLLSTQGAFFNSDTNTGGVSTFLPLATSKTSNNGVAVANYGIGTLGPTPGFYGEFQMVGMSDALTFTRLGIRCGRPDVYFVEGTPSTSNTYALNKTIISDRKLKDDITYTDAAATAALANFDQFNPATFVFKSDEQKRERRGLIAQDLQEIDENYVKLMEWVDDKGERKEQLRLDNNALLMDAILAIHALSAQVKELQKEVAELKAK